MARGEQVLTGDSFFHLAAYGDPLPGLEPVRRGPGGLPDRPGRRRLRLPVRHPRELPGRERPRPGRLRRGVAGLGAVRRAAPSRRPGARASRVRPTTRAAAGAWRPSSSPGCRWTAPTRSASRARRAGARGRRRGPRAQAVRQSFAPSPAARCRSPSAPDQPARTSQAQTGSGLRRESAGSGFSVPDRPRGRRR